MFVSCLCIIFYDTLMLKASVASSLSVVRSQPPGNIAKLKGVVISLSGLQSPLLAAECVPNKYLYLQYKTTEST